MKDRIVIATRNSALALWQANFVRDELLRLHPALQVELEGMTTRGDQWLSTPLAEVGGKGLFIKELEEAMLDGRADIAVHSMKDVPALLPEGFALPVIGYRADVRDALVCRPDSTGRGLASLPAQARIGSSSLRRQAMLLRVRDDLKMSSVRGNVGTRLSKLDAGDYDALVLAAAGLERLGLENRISEYLSVETSLPAPGQGALGVECLAEEADVLGLLAGLNDSRVSACVSAERAVSAGLGADCSAPLGAYAVAEGSRYRLEATLCSPDGRRVLTTRVSGEDAMALGVEAAGALKDQGAAELLAEIAAAAGD